MLGELGELGESILATFLLGDLLGVDLLGAVMKGCFIDLPISCCDLASWLWTQLGWLSCGQGKREWMKRVKLFVE